MAWTQDKMNETYVKVQKTASVDEEFRAELLENPGKAIEKLTGEAVPKDYKIKVIENDPAYAATFVLPAMVSEELADGELDNVAGGACGIDGACAGDACAGKASK